MGFLVFIVAFLAYLYKANGGGLISPVKEYKQ